MASTRLTNAIKDELTTQLLKHAFSDRCQKMVNAEIKFSQKMYDKYLSDTFVQMEGKKVALKDALAILPDTWTSGDYEIRIQFAGETIELSKYYGLGNRYHSYELPGITYTADSERQQWVYPPKYQPYHANYIVDARHKLNDEYNKLLGFRKDLEKEISTVTATTRATLNSVTSIQKLIILWPEVEAFASKFLTEKAVANQMLPVIQREKLNDVLGLPPHSKVA